MPETIYDALRESHERQRSLCRKLLRAPPHSERRIELFTDLRIELGLALVLVSHDLAVVAQVCDDVIVMRDGVVVEAGPTARLLKEPRHDYTRQLVDNHRDYGLEAILEKEIAGV